MTQPSRTRDLIIGRIFLTSGKSLSSISLIRFRRRDSLWWWWWLLLLLLLLWWWFSFNKVFYFFYIFFRKKQQQKKSLLVNFKGFYFAVAAGWSFGKLARKKWRNKKKREKSRHRFVTIRKSCRVREESYIFISLREREKEGVLYINISFSWNNLIN